jgi:N-acyl homoserine lactone hydrolase
MLLLLAACAHKVAPLEVSMAQEPERAPGASVCWVEYARSGPFTASGLVVRAPGGTVLVDAGQSRSFRKELGEIEHGRFYLRLVPGALVPRRPASEVLQQAGVEPGSLVAFVPTHAHSDHVGGLMDLPDLPIRMHPAEQALLESVQAGRGSFNVVPAEARRMSGHITALQFAPEPWATFPEHADVLGDGTVVVVPLEGHTPGSVGVAVDTGSLRLLHAGDAINKVSQLERLRGKSALLRRTDADPQRADERVALLAALHEADPELVVLPAHERRAWRALFGAPGACLGGP